LFITRLALIVPPIFWVALAVKALRLWLAGGGLAVSDYFSKPAVETLLLRTIISFVAAIAGYAICKYLAARIVRADRARAAHKVGM